MTQFPGQKIIFNSKISKKAMSISQRSTSRFGSGIALKKTLGAKMNLMDQQKTPEVLTLKFSDNNYRLNEQIALEEIIADICQAFQNSVLAPIPGMEDDTPPKVSSEDFLAVERIYRLGFVAVESLWLRIEPMIDRFIDQCMINLNKWAENLDKKPYSLACMEFGERFANTFDIIESRLHLAESLLCNIDRGVLQAVWGYPGIFTAAIKKLSYNLADSKVRYGILSAIISILCEVRDNNMVRVNVALKLIEISWQTNVFNCRQFRTVIENRFKYELCFRFDFKNMKPLELFKLVQRHKRNLDTFHSKIPSQIRGGLVPISFSKLIVPLELYNYQTEFTGTINRAVMNGPISLMAVLREINEVCTYYSIYSGLKECVETNLVHIFRASCDMKPTALTFILLKLYRKLEVFVSFQDPRLQEDVRRIYIKQWRLMILGNNNWDERVIISLSKCLDRIAKLKTSYEQKAREIQPLFLTVQSKDLMYAYYQRDLAKRLMSYQHCNTMDRDTIHENAKIEKDLVNILFPENSTPEIKSILAMITNAEDSSDDIENVQNLLGDIHSPLEFTAMIKTESDWPHLNKLKTSVKIPKELQQILKQYGKAYQKLQKKKLTWTQVEDVVEITGEFESGPKQMVMNLFQSAIMLMFNSAKASANGLTYKTIATGTGMKKNDLNPALHCLVMGRIRILGITRADMTSGSSKAKCVYKPSKVEDYNSLDRFHVLDEPIYYFNKDDSDKNLESPNDENKLIFTGYLVSGKYNPKGGGYKKPAPFFDEDPLRENRSLELQALILRIMKKIEAASLPNIFKCVNEALAGHEVLQSKFGPVRDPVSNEEFVDAFNKLLSSSVKVIEPARGNRYSYVPEIMDCTDVERESESDF